jgi:hypothetical protein
VFEPRNLRWIRAYAMANRFPPDSIIKLCFGGEYLRAATRSVARDLGLR